jgi:hypothetical protein
MAIKPLQWIERDNYSTNQVYCETPFGDIGIGTYNGQVFMSFLGGVGINYRSIEHAKTSAEGSWKERLERCFE